MNNNGEFAGITMPVFTAFGWAGEDAALNYALDQLEIFIISLHEELPASVKKVFPFRGISTENQSVFLAASENVEEDVHIAFNARPMSLELQCGITSKDVLVKGLKQVESDPGMLINAVTELSNDWEFRLQQMEINAENGEATHHQDLYKSELTGLTEESGKELFAKASYLNESDHWVTPIYISRRYPSERIATMKTAIVGYMSEQVQLLAPAIRAVTGRRPPKATPKKQPKKKPEPAPKLATPVEKVQPVSVDTSSEEMVYVAELKPLHLRKGFINLTPQHWPYFAQTARTVTRSVAVTCGPVHDNSSAMWRLQPSEMARLVLGPEAHRWLEDTFVPEDEIRFVATKDEKGEILVKLEPVE